MKNRMANVNTIFWQLDENGIFAIHGKGKIQNCGYDSNPVPEWYAVKDNIKEIHIDEGITDIGINAFRNCRNLTKVVLPSSVNFIHAYAFRDCTKLTTMVETSGRTYRYIDDRRDTFFDGSIIFGNEAFYNTPWSFNHWGDFYINDGRLYITFPSTKKALVIPEGVRVLTKFSMNHLHLDSLKFPSTLEEIENFAFFDTTITERMVIPSTVTKIAPYAFADCTLLLSADPQMQEHLLQTTKGSLKERFPHSFKHYAVTTKSQKHYGDFKKMTIKENKIPKKKTDCRHSYVEDNYVDVGNSVFRRIRNGKVVLCIAYDDQHIRSVKSYVWKKETQMVKEYQMFPGMDDQNRVDIWNDSFTDQEAEEVKDAFAYENGAVLKKAGVLRLQNTDSHEEWFWSKDTGNFGGPLELDLLKTWLLQHPTITVETADENRKEDTHNWIRSFVTI